MELAVTAELGHTRSYTVCWLAPCGLRGEKLSQMPAGDFLSPFLPAVHACADAAAGAVVKTSDLRIINGLLHLLWQVTVHCSNKTSGSKITPVCTVPVQGLLRRAWLLAGAG